MRIHQSAAAGEAAPANRAAARPGLAAPRSLGAPGRAFRPHPPNCCRLAPSPFRVPGNLGPGSQFLPGTRARAAAGSQGGGGAGRREEEEEDSFVLRKRPARLAACGAGRQRAQLGEGRADGVWENDIHALDAAAATPAPSNLRGSEVVQACWGKLLNTNAGVTREPWLPLYAASRWHAS